MVKLNQSGYYKDVIKIEVPAGQKVKYDLVGAGASGGSGGSVATKGNDGSPGAAQIPSSEGACLEKSRGIHPLVQDANHVNRVIALHEVDKVASH